MGKYEFSYIDVWLLNSVEEGYHFDPRCRVPDEWVEEILVWEGLWYMVPAVSVRVTDFGMNYLSYRHLGNVVVRLGLSQDKVVTFDMAISSIRDAMLEHLTRPTAVSLRLLGYGMPGLWLLGRGFRGYGESRASDVVKSFVEEMVLDSYKRIYGMLSWSEVVDQSWDRKVYLQGGRTGLSFLGYLRDCARNRLGEQDYFVWFSPRVNSGKIGWKLNFKSFSELKKQDVKCYLEYVLDPQAWDKVWENNGYLDDGKTIPFMWYEVVGGNSVLDTMKSRFVRYSFDLSKLQMQKVIVDAVEEILGKGTRSNILASLLNKAKSMVTEVVSEGSKELTAKTVPDVGLFQKCKMLRKWCVVVPGVVDLEVGDKVRVIFPSGYGGMTEALSGEWVVGEQVHLWSNPGRNYLKKLVLVSDTWKSERKEV
jgi:hypothetical protein